MTKTMVKTSRRIGLALSAGLIAISASAFANKSAMAAAPVESASQKVGQNQQQYQPLLKQNAKPNQKQQQTLQQVPKQNNQQQAHQQVLQPQTQQQAHQQVVQPQTQQQTHQQVSQPQNQQGHRYDWAAYQPGQRPPQWQQYNQGFNPRPYQVDQDSERSYHSQPYDRPSGWYQQRWAYGQTLPGAFWARNYWLSSYWSFGLIDPPYGYVWVRYGPDALLVNVESGLILSAMYGVFV